MKIKNIGLVKLAIVVSVLYCLDPGPGSWGAEKHVLLKFLPANILSLFVLSRVLREGVFKVRRSRLVFFWLIIVLFLLMIFGSLSLYFETNEVDRTFLSRSYIFVSCFFGFFLLQHRECEDVSKFLGQMILLSLPVFFLVSFFHGLGLFGLNKYPHIYHEEIFLVFYSAVYCLFYSRKLAVIVVPVSAATLIMSSKNTGYLLLLLLAVYVVFWVNSRLDKKSKIFSVFISASILMLIPVLVLLMIYYFRDYLPSGSPGVRMVTYYSRFQEFLSSPLFGTLFKSDMIFVLPTKEGELSVPSHSDLLDLLANGGVFTIWILILIPLMVSVKIAYKFSFGDKMKVSERSFLLSSLFFATLIVISFNPIVNQPQLMMFFVFSFVGLVFKDGVYYECPRYRFA